MKPIGNQEKNLIAMPAARASSGPNDELAKRYLTKSNRFRLQQSWSPKFFSSSGCSKVEHDFRKNH